MSGHFEISPSACAEELVRVGLAAAVPNGLSTTPTVLLTDSRTMREGVIFLAYRGVTFNSHSILDQIADQKPALIIHEEPFLSTSASTLQVKDARAAWAQLASLAYGHPGHDLHLIGVTGTNGKTSTVHFIRQLTGEKSASIGTLGAFIGKEQFPTAHTTPDPPELYRFLAAARAAEVKWVAMEASSHAIVQQKLFPLRFQVLIFTSFARDHLDLHGTLESYWQAKQRLFTEHAAPRAHVLLSSTLSRCNELIGDIRSQVGDIIVYGERKQNLNPDAEIERIEYASERTRMHLNCHGSRSQLDSLLIGDFACQNLLASTRAVNVLQGNKALPDDLRHIHPPPGRLELVNETDLKKRGPRVFVDYSHTPDAISSALKALRPATSGNLWIVFGCGGNRDAGKRPLMARAAEADADRIVLTSDNPRNEDPEAIIAATATGFSAAVDYIVEVDRRKAIELAIKDAAQDDTVLIAGKGHETYMELKGVRHHFDDKEEARRALALRSSV